MGLLVVFSIGLISNSKFIVFSFFIIQHCSQLGKRSFPLKVLYRFFKSGREFESRAFNVSPIFKQLFNIHL